MKQKISARPSTGITLVIAAVCMLAFAIPAVAFDHPPGPGDGPGGAGGGQQGGGHEGGQPKPPGDNGGQQGAQPGDQGDDGSGDGQGQGKCGGGSGSGDDNSGDESKKSPKVALPHDPGDNQGAGGGTGKPCGGDFKRKFLNHVWKFGGEADSYDAGVLNMTIEKIYNLPKKFKDQDDPILDEDADVLVGDKTKVVKGGEPVDASALADAEQVRVKGKLLRPSKWHEDADGQPVPTIRAKKISID